MADHYIRAAMLRLFTYGLHIAPWLLAAFALAYLTLRLRDRRSGDIGGNGQRRKAARKQAGEEDHKLDATTNHEIPLLKKR